MSPELKQLLEQLPQLCQRQDSIHAQLQDLHVFANRLGLYDAADTIKKIVGEAKPSTEPQISEQAESSKVRENLTLSISLLDGATASEWQGNKLKAGGDVAGANQAFEHAATLRRMASEAAATERRQGIYLVPLIDRK